MEHLSPLLSSFNLDVVLAVLNLLYMFSKRSNFISRLAPDKRQLLLTRLSHLAASWGGKDNGFGLSVCCTDAPISTFPSSATTLHFEFYAEGREVEGRRAAQSTRWGSRDGLEPAGTAAGLAQCNHNTKVDNTLPIVLNGINTGCFF